jgi:threonine synthase
MLRAGRTPLERTSIVRRLLLKRDDCNPTGSHKDRAAEHQLHLAREQGVRAVTISSSGNAAIATSRFAAEAGVPAVVFVHPSTDPVKLAAIDGSTTIVVITERAINGAKLLARELKIPNLRPSTNDDAVDGYRSLGEELADDLPEEVDAVVLFATSGATALAVAQVLGERRPGIEVHVVQGEGNASIVVPDAEITDASAHGAAAGRLGVRRSRRARQLMRAIEATGGAGHVASAADVTAGRNFLVELEIEVSDESAANVAIARQMTAAGRTVCCIISGAPAPKGGAPAHVITATDEHDALMQVCDLLPE